MSRRLPLMAALALVLGGGAQASGIPPLSQPVMDEANMLAPETTAVLNQTLSGLWRAGGSQVAVLTLPSLQGQTLEATSIAVVDRWQLGKKGKDDGVLLLMVRDERQVRIEVGRGLEGVLTDLRAHRILDEAVTPSLRAGDANTAAVAGVLEIVRTTDPGFDVSELASQAPPDTVVDDGDQGDAGPGAFAVFLAFLLVVGPLWGLLAISSGARTLGSRAFSDWRGRGGGGFRGGGGGFSGGGASGRW